MEKNENKLKTWIGKKVNKIKKDSKTLDKNYLGYKITNLNLKFHLEILRPLPSFKPLGSNLLHDSPVCQKVL